MERAPFSLFTKQLKAGKFWYVRYYNPDTGKYDVYRSTKIKCTGKQGNKFKAYDWAKEHTPEVRINKQKLIPFIKAFWADDSPYLKKKRLVDQKPLSPDYVLAHQIMIKTHLETYKPFKDLYIEDIKPGLIDDWKLYKLEHGLGVRRVNAGMQTMRVPLRYAYERGDLEVYPFRRVKNIPYKPKEKGILTLEEIKKIQETHEPDPRIYLSLQLAIFAGLRRGEVRGLKWEDIDEQHQCIEVRHNFINSEGVKECKWGSSRKAPLSPQIIAALKDVKRVAPYRSKTDFIMFNLEDRTVPCSNALIRSGFNRMMTSIGIKEEERKKRNLTYHGLRHTFVTMARMSGLPDIVVQALAGHKSSQMMDHYSHGNKIIDFSEVIDRISLRMKAKDL